MPNKTWKNFERRVAEKLGGERVIRANYGKSAPDVIANVIEGYSIYAECKYSQNQTWHKKISDILLPNIIVFAEPLYLTETKYGLAFSTLDSLIYHLFLLRTGDMLTKVNEIHVDFIKDLPKVLTSKIDQSLSYSKDWHRLPILCLGQKSSREIITVIKQDKLERFCNEVRDHRSFLLKSITK